MTKTIETSVFGTVPVVVFQRLHVDTGEPLNMHVIIYSDAADAARDAQWIESCSRHLRLVGVTDATFSPRSEELTCQS